MQYETDLIKFLLWAVGMLGAGLIAVSLWAAKSIIGSIGELKLMVQQDLRELRELFHGIDKRVIRLEAMNHRRTSHPESGET